MKRKRGLFECLHFKVGGRAVYFTRSSKTYLPLSVQAKVFIGIDRGTRQRDQGEQAISPDKGKIKAGGAERKYKVMLLLRKGSTGRGGG